VVSLLTSRICQAMLCNAVIGCKTYPDITSIKVTASLTVYVCSLGS
jgi:hypothetical protein